MCSLCGWWLSSSLKLSLKGKGLQCQARQGRAAPHYYQLQAGQGNGGQPPTIHSELTFLVPGALAQGSLELGAPDSASCAAQSQQGLSHCLTHCEPPGCGDPRRRGPHSPKHQPTPCLAYVWALASNWEASGFVMHRPRCCLTHRGDECDLWKLLVT